GLGKRRDKIHRARMQESEVHALVKSLPSPINEIIFQPVEDESTEPHSEFEEFDVAVDGHEDDDVELL
ncbi:MAG: hypothetical protein O2866_05325, partial [archaeon]|nr:hypothetical protein [archaeon]